MVGDGISKLDHVNSLPMQELGMSIASRSVPERSSTLLVHGMTSAGVSTDLMKPGSAVTEAIEEDSTFRFGGHATGDSATYYL